VPVVLRGIHDKAACVCMDSDIYLRSRISIVSRWRWKGIRMA